MPTFSDEQIDDVKNRLLAGMVSYMQADVGQPDSDFDCGYTQDDVDRCAEIVDSYLASVLKDAVSTDAEIRAAVEKTVLELNRLNEQCGFSLIETDQREDLCQLIQIAAKRAGLATDEDITEQWREW